MKLKIKINPIAIKDIRDAKEYIREEIVVLLSNFQKE